MENATNPPLQIRMFSELAGSPACALCQSRAAHRVVMGPPSRCVLSVCPNPKDHVGPAVCDECIKAAHRLLYG